jgi:hypothetical protein
MARVALADYRMTRGELLRLESIGNLGSLIRRKRRQERDFLEEMLVHATTSEGGFH